MTLMLRNALTPWRDFDRFFATPTVRQGWTPRFDTRETETAYILHGDIPGVNQKDIEVRLDDGILSIRGERTHEAGEDCPHGRERLFGAFRRSFRLPGQADEEGITATYEDGVLTLTVPKQEPVDTSRQIPVN